MDDKIKEPRYMVRFYKLPNGKETLGLIDDTHEAWDEKVYQEQIKNEGNEQYFD